LKFAPRFASRKPPKTWITRCTIRFWVSDLRPY
jgi:DNA-directed RNA polymerase specialized sigma24 family protein